MFLQSTQASSRILTIKCPLVWNGPLRTSNCIAWQIACIWLGSGILLFKTCTLRGMPFHGWGARDLTRSWSWSGYAFMHLCSCNRKAGLRKTNNSYVGLLLVPRVAWCLGKGSMVMESGLLPHVFLTWNEQCKNLEMLMPTSLITAWKKTTASLDKCQSYMRGCTTEKNLRTLWIRGENANSIRPSLITVWVKISLGRFPAKVEGYQQKTWRGMCWKHIKWKQRSQFNVFAKGIECTKLRTSEALAGWNPGPQIIVRTKWLHNCCSCPMPAAISANQQFLAAEITCQPGSGRKSDR